MKKQIFILLLAILLVLSSATSLIGCQQDTTELTLYVPDGAPALSIATLLNDKYVDGSIINTTITNAATVQAKVMAGLVDMAIVPVNMAWNIYNSNAEYKLLSVNTFGLLYIVGSNCIDNIEQLVGQVLHSIGKNSIPQYVFTTILDYFEIPYVESDVAVEGKVAIKYYSEGSGIISQIASGTIRYALLGEPACSKFLTISSANSQEADRLFDLQQLWQVATNSSQQGYPQAGLIVKQDLLDRNIALVNAIADRLADNDEFLQNNIATLSQLLVDNGSVDWSVNIIDSQLITRCNVRFVLASTISQDIIEYLAKFGIQADDGLIHR